MFKGLTENMSDKNIMQLGTVFLNKSVDANNFFQFINNTVSITACVSKHWHSRECLL